MVIVSLLYTVFYRCLVVMYLTEAYLFCIVIIMITREGKTSYTVVFISYPEMNQVQYPAAVNDKIQETKTKSVRKSKLVNKHMLWYMWTLKREWDQVALTQPNNLDMFQAY